MNSGGMPMELRHITSFLVLAEELHFGRSAARLHISQPSLSLQLQQLERRVGVELVARTSHSVRLTPAGEASAGKPGCWSVSLTGPSWRPGRPGLRLTGSCASASTFRRASVSSCRRSP
jgi:hypothetical protein